MLTALRQGRVAGLQVTVACAETLDEVPHDVYVLDLAPPPGAEPAQEFDELPYLECLEPVLEAVGGRPSWMVDLARSHRSDDDGVGHAQVSLALATGRKTYATDPDPDLSEVVRAALARMVVVSPALRGGGPMERAEAVAAGTAAVVHGYPGVDADVLSLTDEEHHAAEGRWTLGLALPGVARFHVLLGLVAGAPASAHVRRMPVSEVVDSVGT